MNAIVSVTRDWGIGFKGRLLVRNPADMRSFRELTTGGTVVCGHTTYQSFPHGALPNRRNIVLSRDAGFAPADAEVVRSVGEALMAVSGENPARVWLIGGDAVYRQLLPHCASAYVTKHDIEVPADAFFPNLDDDPAWELVSTTPGGLTPAGIPFFFCRYRNRSCS